jgi:putative transposase
MSAYRELFTREFDQDLISDVRNALNTGLVLGSERFRKEVEQLTGQRQYHRKRGPKPKLQP